MKFNLTAILRIMGLLLLFNSGFMLLCLPFAIYYKEPIIPILASAVITFIFGFIMFKNHGKNSKELSKKDGYLIVTLGWITMSLFGTLPYLISGEIPSFTNAFFETVSGFTTTGASILNDIEAKSHYILMWRSLTQWIGGMGIIVLAVAILPILGIGGMQLFVAESPGISPDKMKPRIQDTAKRLWIIYVGITLLECVLLMFGGMGFFDALNHSLTTMATGGFSTKQDSIAYWDSPYIQYVIIFFMLMAGTNFTITYYLLKGKVKKALANEEYRFYIITLALATLVITFFLISSDTSNIEKSFRDALFQVVSVVTTTGFITGDYTTWGAGVMVMFFVMMFLGGSTGSTAGGIKIVRHAIILKNSILEIKRQLHPSAILPVRVNGKAINQSITFNVLAFIMLYFAVFLVGILLMSFTELDFESSLGAVATSVGNIGPGLGSVGPVFNFADVSAFGKWVLSFLMILGRLELFTVLILFSPYYWKKF